MSKDYYKTLGVDKKASEAEIKAAFRKLAHEHHPDKNGGKDEKFKEINEAYQTLSDKNKRAQYDQFGSGGPQFGGGQQGNPFGGQEDSVDFHGKISCDRHSREVVRSLIWVISILEICLGRLLVLVGTRPQREKYRGSNKNDVQRISAWIYKDS
jgi:DnaJ-class molecular chaperone